LSIVVSFCDALERNGKGKFELDESLFDIIKLGLETGILGLGHYQQEIYD
jgi:hypothetical protein